MRPTGSPRPSSAASLRIAVVASGVLLAACPPEDKRAPPSSTAPTAACTKFGATCEVAPGKLGTCVQQDDCGRPGGCLVCQSQH